MSDRKKLVDSELIDSSSAADGGRWVSRSIASRSCPEVDVQGFGAASSAPGDGDDSAEWDRYVPDGVLISENRRRELRREHERYLAELIAEVGEPTAKETARAEAWWHPIEQHLTKDASA